MGREHSPLSFSYKGKNIMTFETENLKEVGGPGNSDLGGQVYSVHSDSDTLAEMMAPGYLNAKNETFNSKDSVLFSANDGSQLAQINISTSGNITVQIIKVDNFDSVTGGGDIDAIFPVTLISTGGAEGYVLKDGVPGQRKTLILQVDGGNATVTPTNFINTNIIFGDKGDSVEMIFTSQVGWVVTAQNGVSITA